MSNLGLSIIIVGKNCEDTIKDCLISIYKQSFKPKKFEIIYLDGGSTDSTLEIISDYKDIKIYSNYYPDNQEARRYIGYKLSKYEILAYIDSDNILTDDNLLKDLYLPFENDEKILASFTKWYGVDHNISALDNYFALLGGNDPISFYLKKNDRMPYLINDLPFASYLIDRSQNYDVVSFKINKLPTLGCNGFFIKKVYLDSLDIKDPEDFFHIDINFDILKKYKNLRYAIIRKAIIHKTAKSLTFLLKKRLQYRNLHNDNYKRRYLVFDSKNKEDIVSILKLLLSCLTILPLFFTAFKYLWLTKRKEWLLHPFVTISFVLAYSFSVLSNLKTIEKK